MKLINATTSCQIRHHQVRRATTNSGGVGRLGAACSSALAVPGDPLDTIVQCLGAEDNNGFAVDTGGAWFEDFFDGGMDVAMSTCAGAEEFMEMLMDLPVPDTTVLATATATLTRAAAATAAVPKLSPMSVSSSDGMDEEDEDHWVSSSDDSSSDDDAADVHWLPSNSSKKRSGTRRRLQQSSPAGQRKQQAESVALSAPHAMVLAAEGGGTDRWWCRHCGTVETPLWRAGPDGAKTLCNACGLRYKNKTASLTCTVRRPTAKAPVRGEGRNQTVPDTTVVRKKRSTAIRVDID